MKKITLTVFLVLSLVLIVSCTEDKTTTEEDVSTDEKDAPTETDTVTTDKIYAPSPEGIRPDNATKSSSREGNGFIIASALLQKNSSSVRTPRNMQPSETTAPLSIKNSLYASVLAHALEEDIFSYWYECDYYGNCLDSEGYKWFDCYYNSKAKSCDKGDFWETEEYWEECDSYGNCIDSKGYKWYDAEEDSRPLPEDDIIAEPGYPKLCCDSWGKCYDENSDPYDDPTYLVTNYCDQCGNCYDYYGNYAETDESAVNKEECELYNSYNYDEINEWDVCGNAYDKDGNFLFYDNYYYDFQACNGDSKYYCVEAAYDDIEGFGGPDLDYIDDYCDECGNCYDYYGNELGFDEAYYDEYWCSQYYQYDKVWEWDDCGNAYDKDGTFLFYDNEHYDYKKCYEDETANSPDLPLDPPRVYPTVLTDP